MLRRARQGPHRAACRRSANSSSRVAVISLLRCACSRPDNTSIDIHSVDKEVRLDHLLGETVKSASELLDFLIGQSLGGMTRRLGAHLIVASGHRDGVATFSSGLPFLTGNRTAILKPDPHGEIIPIEIECNVDVLGVQIWAARI